MTKHRQKKFDSSANRIGYLETLAREIRCDVLRIACSAKSAHIASSLSIIDILVVLYFEILKLKSSDINWDWRDRFVLSKGHGCLGLYVVLSKIGFIDSQQLESFCSDGGCLGGHPELGVITGLEASTGSLGHGLSIGLGMAISLKVDKKKSRVFVLLGDGECNEGSVWEAAMAASHFKADNLCAIIDYNKFQATGRTEEVMGLEPLKKKWEAFGWSAKEIDGHNISEILYTLRGFPFRKGKPSVIIAHTVKGKGVSFMENKLAWHYRPPSDLDLKKAIKELTILKT